MANERDLRAGLARSFFTGRQNSFESTISFLEEKLNVSGLREIPEYQTVVDALKAYGDAVARHYLEESSKRGA